MTPEEWLQSYEEGDYHILNWHEGSAHFWRSVLDLRPEAACWVARNKKLPREIIEELSNNPDEDVRYWIAIKNSIPADVLATLATDPSSSVRKQIAMGKNTPLSILRELACDPIDWVAESARETIGSR